MHRDHGDGLKPTRQTIILSEQSRNPQRVKQIPPLMSLEMSWTRGKLSIFLAEGKHRSRPLEEAD